MGGRRLWWHEIRLGFLAQQVFLGIWNGLDGRHHRRVVGTLQTDQVSLENILEGLGVKGGCEYQFR